MCAGNTDVRRIREQTTTGWVVWVVSLVPSAYDIRSSHVQGIQTVRKLCCGTVRASPGCKRRWDACGWSSRPCGWSHSCRQTHSTRWSDVRLVTAVMQTIGSAPVVTQPGALMSDIKEKRSKQGRRGHYRMETVINAAPFLPFNLVDPYVVNQEVRRQVLAHVVRHCAGAVGVAAVEAVTGAALGAGRGEAPRAADGGVEDQVPVVGGGQWWEGSQSTEIACVNTEGNRSGQYASTMNRNSTNI